MYKMDGSQWSLDNIFGILICVILGLGIEIVCTFDEI